MIFGGNWKGGTLLNVSCMLKGTSGWRLLATRQFNTINYTHISQLGKHFINTSFNGHLTQVTRDLWGGEMIIFLCLALTLYRSVSYSVLFTFYQCCKNRAFVFNKIIDFWITKNKSLPPSWPTWPATQSSFLPEISNTRKMLNFRVRPLRRWERKRFWVKRQKHPHEMAN